MEHTITIKETRTRQETVEASSRIEAVGKVKQKYYEGYFDPFENEEGVSTCEVVFE